MRPLVLEAAHRSDGTPGVYYRFVCDSCSPRVEGAWHESLNDAEDSARRHNRMHHKEALSA